MGNGIEQDLGETLGAEFEGAAPGGFLGPLPLDDERQGLAERGNEFVVGYGPDAAFGEFYTDDDSCPVSAR